MMVKQIRVGVGRVNECQDCEGHGYKGQVRKRGPGLMWIRTIRAGSGRPRLIRDRALKGQVHLLTLTWGPIIGRQILEATVFGIRDVYIPQPLGHLLVLAIDLRLSVLVYLLLSFGNSPVRELSFPTTSRTPPPPPHNPRSFGLCVEGMAQRIHVINARE